MATFFGEILPVTSRAVDEDDDDDDIGYIPSSVVLRWSPKAKEEIASKDGISCFNLVIAIGNAATAFSRTYLMDEDVEILGAVCSGMNDKDANTFSQRSPTDKTCYIYRLLRQPETLLIPCNISVSSEQAFSWTQLVFPHLKSEELYVAVLSTCSISEYRSEKAAHDLDTPFLRALKSSEFKGTPVCQYLEQPNTMTGLPAQILTYCQTHDIPAVVYQCYTDSLYLDTVAINTFRKVLTSTPFKDFVLENTKADEMLTNIVDFYNADNTLYI